MYECLYCGKPLDKNNVCTNPECQGYPHGKLLHSHTEEKVLCTDEDCRHHDGTLYTMPQLHCTYCEYSAGLDGSCDDDDCPTHDSMFHEEVCRDPKCPTHGPVLAHIGTVPRDYEDPEGRRPPGWLVDDGLLLPDGTPTELGKDHMDWIVPRWVQAEPIAK